MRSEFALIAAGFSMMPALTAGTAVVVNSGGTALTNTVGTLALGGAFATTGGYGTTLIEQAATSLTLPLTSDTLVGRTTTDTLLNKTLTAPVFNGTVTGTYTLGGTLAITGATINGNTITSGSGTLTLAAGKTFTVSNTLTLTGTDGSSVAFGTGGTIGTVGYSTPGQLPGTATNDSVTSGNVGEFLDTTGTTPLTTSTPTTICSLLVPAGDCLLTGHFYTIPATNCVQVEIDACISGVTNTLQAPPNLGAQVQHFPSSNAGSNKISMPVGTMRVQNASPKTYYLVGNVVFNTATLSAGGYLSYSRRR